MEYIKILWEVLICGTITLIDKFKSIKVFTVYFAIIFGGVLAIQLKAPFGELAAYIIALVGLLITGNIVQKIKVPLPPAPPKDNA
jgi:hypothetical protein